MNWDLLWKVGGAVIASASLLFGAGRYVGHLEQRLDQLERKELYLHGTINLPQAK